MSLPTQFGKEPIKRAESLELKGEKWKDLVSLCMKCKAAIAIAIGEAVFER